MARLVPGDDEVWTGSGTSHHHIAPKGWGRDASQGPWTAEPALLAHLGVSGRVTVKHWWLCKEEPPGTLPWVECKAATFKAQGTMKQFKSLSWGPHGSTLVSFPGSL